MCAGEWVCMQGLDWSSYFVDVWWHWVREYLTNCKHMWVHIWYTHIAFVCVCVCVLAITFPLPVVYCLSSRGFAWGTDSSVCSSVIIINTRLSFPGHQLHTLCQAPWRLIQTHKVPSRAYKKHDVLSNSCNINPSLAIFNTQSKL